MKNIWNVRSNKNKMLLICCLVLTFPLFSQNIQVQETLLENRINPLGIDETQPKFSWILKSGKRSVKQSAYQLQVSEDSTNFNDNLIWDSNKIESDKSVHVLY